MDATLLAWPPSLDEALLAEEPALEIALPDVCAQPDLTAIQRGRLKDVEELIGRILHGYQRTGVLGPDYQLLTTEFQPMLAWAVSCWDHLLSTEGPRFIPRSLDDKLTYRGDYRALTDQGYSRLVHRVFRQSVRAFAEQLEEPSFARYLRGRLWEQILGAYRDLNRPADARQRDLTAFSYLRCVPYQFLNVYHQELADGALRTLPQEQQRVLKTYFLHFFTLPATAEATAEPVDAAAEHLRQGLVTLLIHDHLVYCLLRQIERY